MANDIRCAVAEVDPLVRAILVRALAFQEGIDVVTASDSLALLVEAPLGRVDVALIGCLADVDPLVAIPLLLSRGTRSIVVSPTALDETGSKLLLAGASGFLLVSDVGFDAVASAVRAVASGQAALHPDVARAVLEQWRAARAPVEAASTATLSAREVEILVALSRGMTTRQMSSALRIAEKTIESHRSRLYAKLGARNQAHAVRRATELGLLATEETETSP